MKKFKQKKEENHTLTHTDTHTFTNELFFENQKKNINAEAANILGGSLTRKIQCYIDSDTLSNISVLCYLLFFPSPFLSCSLKLYEAKAFDKIYTHTLFRILESYK